MCQPAPCPVCGRATWTGCGRHVDQVRAQVPADQWCEGHPEQTGRACAVAPGVPGSPWAMERQVRATAGGIVLASVLASTVAPRSKWVAAGIGGGLVYSALSDTCGLAAVLARMPWNRRAAAGTRPVGTDPTGR